MLVLLDDMPDLMALFMDHGLDLVEFVTDDRLCYLYEQVNVAKLFLYQLMHT